MTRLILRLEKSVEQNAEGYFQHAKRQRKRLQGAIAALAESELKLISAEKRLAISRDEPALRQKAKKEWYEKFHWFLSSEGFLVIGGRDATTNEVIIKKHTLPDDIVLHTDMAGSPFFVIKTEGSQPGSQTLKEAAIATASYSRAWKLGHSSAAVFYVKPEQVSKKAQSGEYLGRGAFMIYGKTNYLDNKMQLAVGIQGGRLIGGPLSAVQKKAEKWAEILQGEDRPSEAAKKIRKMIGGEIDDIIRFLPSGSIKVMGK